MTMEEDDRTDGVPLTPQEQRVLQTALERGYFDVPRRISTVALAVEVGVSDRELTEHLRRATAKVVKHSRWEPSVVTDE